MSARERDFGLELTRAAAVVLVLSVHFFLNTGFYELPMTGAAMTVSAAVRMACMPCVPLFMLLTGYLCADRRWERGYLWKLAPVVLTYLGAAAACLAFRWIWMGQRFTLSGIIRRVLDFSAAPYGWYVEMYIGLFLLVPFLNAAWRGLDERGRRVMVLAFASLTALPTVTNMVHQLLPDWWTGIYPLTYYVLGAWLRDHPVRVRGRWLALGWLVPAAVTGALALWLFRDVPFDWNPIVGWGSALLTVETVCLFSLLRRCGGQGWPRPVRWCVARIARLSLPIYLMSYVTDQLVYPHLTGAVPDMGGRLIWLPAAAGTSLLCSALLAQVLDWAVRAALRLMPRQKEAAASGTP